MDAVETEAVAAIRRFNRFHTRWVGALGGSLHGSGLGLAIVRQLAEAHGGSVTAANAEGGGAELRLDLAPQTFLGSS